MLKLAYTQQFKAPCALLLGGFDGLHLGHRALLNEAKKTRLPVGLTAIYGGKAGGNLFNGSEREQIFLRAGVDFMLELQFSEIKDIPPREFLDRIFSDINAKYVFCGEDFRFGKDAAGTVELLKECAPCNVCVLPIRTVNGQKVATSSVKELIKEGKIAEANALLDDDFMLIGCVEHGRHVGTQYGFPTANLSYPQEKIPLKEGVYGGYATVDGTRYLAMINVGARPTFAVRESKVEAHLLDFSGDLYGKTVELALKHYLRPIIKFADMHGLKEQLIKDKEDVRRKI